MINRNKTKCFKEEHLTNKIIHKFYESTRTQPCLSSNKILIYLKCKRIVLFIFDGIIIFMEN